jgi:hypothetical protein
MCIVGGALIASPANGLLAQVVRGSVTERGTTAPLPGVLLSLIDESGRTVAATLSDERGAYEVRAPSAGRFTLVIKRIGVRPTRSAPFALDANETHQEVIVVEAVVPALGAVRVTERASCRQPANGDARLVALWEDTRAALTAAVLTARGGERARVTRFQRDLDTETGRVVHDERRTSMETLTNLFRSLPAARLAREGYVVPRDNGTVDYYAPDAEVLLSDEFLATHCFRVVPGEKLHAAHVGLAFTPTRERKLPDVTGVLWLDASSSELREVEFTYHAFPRGVIGDATHDGLGGRVHFARMANGRWIVDDWRIRMPLVSELKRGTGESRLTRVREAGGSVESERTLAENPSRASGATIVGTVFDSVAGALASGARVVIEGTSYSATTGADGRFSLADVPVGTYTVAVTSPVLDSLGVRVPASMLDVTTTQTTPVRLALPSLRTRVERMCVDPVNMDRESVVRVRVVDANNGEALRDARIRAWWNELVATATSVIEVRREAEARLDERGQTTLCGVLGGTRVHVESAGEVALRWRDTLRLEAGTVASRVMVVRPVAELAGASSSRGKGSAARRGDRAVATSAGSNVATTLERADGSGPAMFERHRAEKRGFFLDRKALGARSSSRTSDVLRAAAGTRLIVLRSGGTTVASTTPPTEGQLATINSWNASGAERYMPACYMQVLLDGVRLWSWGGQPPIDIDSFSVNSLSAVEVYRSAAETPIEYGGTGALCGTVVLWTSAR